ncbi:MAG: endonuclease domain-containing protein [Phenylobacterium sp.]|uniref:endonuclease domain-containing protein n=1 Tax=Phenylobacterium sp. TaxID=1871053 RepID=UPI003444871B|nr:endonuclease domain-containing protein [Phenylobacterium sp.]
MPRNASTAKARSLRATQTNAEGYLWASLRNRQLGGWKWRRQVGVGPFIVDFLCIEAGLVIELDGGGHAERLEQDALRTAMLGAHGLRVIRFWNHGVFESREGVCDAILAACGGERSPHPTLSPEGRGKRPSRLHDTSLSRRGEGRVRRRR